MTEKLLRKSRALEALDISRPTLDRMIARGDLAIVRVGERGVRIAESEIRRLIDSRTERRGQ
jgi:excisionase family DNA binding protein